MIDINKKLNEKYHRNNVDNRIKYHFISIIRIYIAHFNRYKYALEKLGY